MRFDSLLLAVISSFTTITASHVGYTYSPGSSPSHTVTVVLTLGIPRAYDIIPNIIPGVDGLARAILGDLYAISSSEWMFPPVATYFQYANSVTNYVNVGASLDFSGADAEIAQDICAVIAQAWNIPNKGFTGDTRKRDTQESTWGVLSERDRETLLMKRDSQQCPAYRNPAPYITGDKILSPNTSGGCIP